MKALRSKKRIFWILYNNDGNEIMFRLNDNGIEWKFVIDKIMYYKENVIFSIISINIKLNREGKI